MASRPQPLQPLTHHDVNGRGINTPMKQSPAPAASKLEPTTASKPRKKKEKLSALCKTPPSIVRTRNGRDYRRGNFLGEGGFARCFQMKDASGQIYAAKTVAKVSIKNEKTKTKLLSEIKIHKSLKHPNIVNFVDCFEDDVNVYILLEICPNQSLMELLKTRKRVSEPEVRFFMVQIVGAIMYLHSRRVIHRDLKLGNIFFDPHMNLKIGDFGLASVLSADSRKYTICGTPNYIAPEVLGGKTTGHSFEVDIWAIGIMMYALLIGKPPFQAKDVNVIYERIKRAEYSFPPDKPISDEARVLITDLLSLNPLERPSINEILAYDWFKGSFPDRTHEMSLVDTPPHLDNISRAQSAQNFSTTKHNAGITPSRSRDPVEILRTDLQSEQPRALLPTSLSPNDTRAKYQEVDPASLGRPRKVNFNTDFSATIKRLDKNCRKTYDNMRRLGVNPRAELEGELPQCDNPTLISKWVDYSNKYGFSYQLTNDDIGVLFNDGNTVLKSHNSDRFLELIHHEHEGWTSVENSLSHPPAQAKRQLEIVEFFAKYMNSNLSKVSDNEERTETVFLRRYTRTTEYIMFEMTNGNYQFNFKDHHKMCISKTGLAITHISPQRVTQTHPLAVVLAHENFPRGDVPDCMAKIKVIRDAIKSKVLELQQGA